MTEYTISEIASIIGARQPEYPDVAISTLLTDSRALTDPASTLFFALRTPSADGHRFVAALQRRGVRNFVVSSIPADADTSASNFLVVPDPLAALQRIGVAHRCKYPSLPVVGITGSRGKTTVKEWLWQIFGPVMPTLRSPRSYNSQTGVPLSVWAIGPDTRLAIFEAGISQKGEMEHIAPIICPTIGVMTCITDEHADGFLSIREKCEEKFRLMADGRCSIIVCPADDSVIMECAASTAASTGARIVSWSRHPETDATLTIHSVTTATDGNNDGKVSCAIEFSYKNGTHHTCIMPFGADDTSSVDDAATAMATSLAIGMAPDELAGRMSGIRFSGTRMSVIEGVNHCLLISDQQESTDIASVSTAIDFAARRVTPQTSLTVILSDLPSSADYPAAARLLAVRGCRRLIAVGKEISRNIALFADIPQTSCHADMESFLEAVTPSDFDNEVIVIKDNGLGHFGLLRQLLEASRHETVLEVDLDALVSNFNHFRALLRPSTGMVAMVKAYGYGAGSYELARTLQSQGAAYLAVACADEGVELRRNGISMPIMVLNPKVTNYRTLFDYRLEPEIYSIDILQEIIAEGRRRSVEGFPVHIKVDSGMHRLGFLEEDMEQVAGILAGQHTVTAKSVFSHLAAADSPEMDDYTMEQFGYFDRCCAILQQRLPYYVMRHILNSTGIARFPEHQMDMVRLGICLYGVATLPDVPAMQGLRTVSTLRSVVISVKHWDAGTTIGYNRRGVLSRPSVIATIPIGYADGLDRHLGYGNASVLIRGRRCPIVGSICMDICMVDVTDLPECKVGDTVEIFGPNITVDELAQTLSTIPYEILTSVSSRVKRVYYRE